MVKHIVEDIKMDIEFKCFSKITDIDCNPSLVLLDLQLEKTNPQETLLLFRSMYPRTKVILFTATDSKKLESIIGAECYINKNDLQDSIIRKLRDSIIKELEKFQA